MSVSSYCLGVGEEQHTSSAETAWEPSAPNVSMLEIAAFKSVRLLSAEASPDAPAFPAMCANTPAKFTLTCITGTLCEHPHAAGMGLTLEHHPCGFHM